MEDYRDRIPKPVYKSNKDTMVVLEKNRAKLEAKYGKVRFEPIDMSSMVLIRKTDGMTYVASWNLMTKPPKLVIDKVGMTPKNRNKDEGL